MASLLLQASLLFLASTLLLLQCSTILGFYEVPADPAASGDSDIVDFLAALDVPGVACVPAVADVPTFIKTLPVLESVLLFA
jgi:hypothetical protein